MLGGCLHTLGIFLKNAEAAQFLGAFFHGKSCILLLAKDWFGHTFVNF
jgi:hypothetical protein